MIEEKHIEELTNIANSYRYKEKVIASQLAMNSKHPTTAGTNREKIWMGLFKSIVPHKFSIEHSVFIIDSTGKVSNEVDIAIFDEQYTPYIFRFENFKYIPIEAVALVVECKSTSEDYDALVTWSNSINALQTSANAIVRINIGIHYLNDQLKTSTQTGTRPIKILCHMYDVDNKANMKYLKEDMFDFVLQEKGEKLILHKPKDKKLSDWYQTLNHKTALDWPKSVEQVPYSSEKANHELDDYLISDGEGNVNTVLSLVFMLNQLLMLINNPFFFPHLSYVKLFDDIEKGKLEITAKNVERENENETV